MAGFWKRGDDLEQRLRAERPTPRNEFVQMLAERVESTPLRRRATFRLGLAATVTAVMVLSLAAFGGLGYAATSVSHAVKTAVHVVTPNTHKAAASSASLNSAAAQYGKKETICDVNEKNGKEKTKQIDTKKDAAYFAKHPEDFHGACGANRPRGVTNNVCLVSKKSIFVPAGQVNSYLKRNAKAHTTKNGKC